MAGRETTAEARRGEKDIAEFFCQSSLWALLKTSIKGVVFGQTLDVIRHAVSFGSKNCFQKYVGEGEQANKGLAEKVARLQRGRLMFKNLH